MQQTENTAIVLRYANYKDNDRMLTLLSPTRGRIDVLARGCRRPRSPLLGASELFALGDYQLYIKQDRATLVSAALIESFYPLRNDFDRLSVGVYMLNLCENAIQPGEPCQELFMLLLHTLSRLTFTTQRWKPLLCGFLLHFAASEGYKPRLNHCVRCGQPLSEDQPVYFDGAGGGLCHLDCREPGCVALSPAQVRWLKQAMQSGAAGWVDTEDTQAPFPIIRDYVEKRLDRPLKAGKLLPEAEG